MLRFKLGKVLDHIVAPNNPLQKTVFDLIEIADREGWLNELLDTAHATNPGNATLAALVAEVNQWELDAQLPAVPSVPILPAPVTRRALINLRAVAATAMILGLVVVAGLVQALSSSNSADNGDRLLFSRIEPTPPPTIVLPASANHGFVLYTRHDLDNATQRAIIYHDLTTNESWPLTNDLYQNFSPAISPDGTQVVYTSLRDNQYDLYIGDLLPERNTVTLANVRPLLFDRGDESHPAWSPDGKQIAFQTNRNGNFDIYTINTDGTNLTQITADRAPELGPQWSPDGQSIVYARQEYQNNVYRIWVMDADGGNQRRLTNNHDRSFRFPSWSPDGSTIAFYATELDSHVSIGIQTISTDGSNLQSVTFGEDYHPSWTPLGDWLLFHRRVDRSADKRRVIHHVRPTGSDLGVLDAFPSEFDTRRPDWWCAARDSADFCAPSDS